MLSYTMYRERMREIITPSDRIRTRHSRMVKAAALAAAVALALPAVGPAYAHAFGQRYDLPIPLSYFLAGAAAAVALSFVALGLFVRGGNEAFRYPRLNLLAVPALGRAISSRALLLPIRAASVALLLLTLATALFGSENPLANFAPTFVWIIWWVGMGFVAALLGNLWMLINPWKALFELGEWLARRVRGGGNEGSGGKRHEGLLPYPDGWDALPALAGFAAFAWLENVYPGSIVPLHLGVIVLAYTLVTLGGMALFGKHTWLRYGDCFSVLFGIFARFSPTEARVVGGACGNCPLCARDGGFASDEGCVDCYACFEAASGDAAGRREFNLRPWAAGLVPSGRVSLPMAAFVGAALAAVTFDGLQETPSWAGAQRVGVDLLGAGGISAVDTLGVALVPAAFFGAYVAFCAGIRALSGERASLMEVAQAYVFSLVPIALAYNMAHFFGLLMVQGQLILPLASDPFGFGWDVFGMAGYRIDPAVVSTRAAWFLSVGLIVVGHIVSVYIAHTISLRRAASHSLALRGQYPMIALMVIYTAASLWIIAQPIVN